MLWNFCRGGDYTYVVITGQDVNNSLDYVASWNSWGRITAWQAIPPSSNSCCMFNPFTVNFFLELFLNYDQLTYKNSLCSECAVKSLATTYFWIARDLMNVMTSLPLLSNQVCAINSRLFINFAQIIIIKFISVHIQNNARHYGMVSIFCSMLRSLRVPSGVPRGWSRPLGSWSQQPSKRSHQNWIWTIELSGTPCSKTLKPNQLVIDQSDIIIRDPSTCVRMCVRHLKKQGYIAKSNIHDFDGQSV